MAPKTRGGIDGGQMKLGTSLTSHRGARSRVYVQFELKGLGQGSLPKGLGHFGPGASD